MQPGASQYVQFHTYKRFWLPNQVSHVFETFVEFEIIVSPPFRCPLRPASYDRAILWAVTCSHPGSVCGLPGWQRAVGHAEAGVCGHQQGARGRDERLLRRQGLAG
eukprot:scaffold647988_cov51-Prasinocladus_malaysianus.AAC.1